LDTGRGQETGKDGEKEKYIESMYKFAWIMTKVDISNYSQVKLRLPVD
jgi:hypothetical protein